MRFGVLGPVGVTAGDQRVTLGGGHQRTILAVLLAAGGEAVPTERLIEAVWGGDPPATARKSLQSHLSRLRRALAETGRADPHPVATVPEGYRIDLDAHDVDAARFESLVARAREVTDPERAAAHLAQARGLWRGPAFGELASHPHVRAEAVRLERLRTAATADHVDARLALGRHQEIVGELEAAAAEHPFDERVHGQLMLALYRGGRQADALATYRQVRQRLRDELGVDPSPELQDLHGRILRQDAGLALPAAGDAPAPHRADAGRPSPQRPPAPAARLIGRDEEVATIATLIAEHPLVTLTGPGGVGKTRLAEQVAARVADRFDDGVAWCALAGVRDPHDVGGALITMLGIQPTGERSALDTLASVLGERRLLLLLDNCEHVLEALTPLIEGLLGRCPNTAILATSRERLHLPAEHVRQIGPLDVPATGAGPEEVAATPAGALFRTRAEAVAPTFSLTDGNAGAVGELCRRLDGMPLAIELAAARVRALAPQDLVARLDQRFSLLAGGPRGITGRHQTLQAVVAWSYDLLDEPEARLFDRLSVFAGGFRLAAAEEVCAGSDSVAGSGVAGLLSELVDKSMVVVERDEGAVRYRLLDTLRAFGARRLADRTATDSLRRAHADYHLGLAQRLGPRVRRTDEPEAVAEIDAAIDDLRSAHAWMVSSGEVGGALRLPVALSDYIFYRLRDEMITWTHRALELPGADRDPAYPAALATAAMGATHRGEYGLAAEQAREAMERDEPDSMATVWALVALGATALYEGRFDDLRRIAEHQAGVADRLGDRYHGAFAMVFRVLAHLYRGEHEQALSHLDDLHGAAATAGNPTMQAFARYCHGEVHLDTDPAEAVAALEQAVDRARQVNNLMIEGVSLVSLASLQGRRGETDVALGLFRDVIAHWRRRGNYTYQLTTLRNLVELLSEIGADEPAAVLHGAVTEGLAPSFGPEAERLAEAWRQLERRMGAAAAAAAAERGGSLDPAQMGDEALAQLDALLADRG